VLRELIDARLLTSYEIREEDKEQTRRVEIIHESLLANWPRLVRWQTQDADAAQLRDQLRQAAKTWDDQGRSDDTLWTGSAYREFAVWRERYSGGLTGLEEGFAQAMTNHARRRKRRRRIAVAAAFVVLLAVVAIVGLSRQQAVSEARRAEAAKLLALAQLELDDDHTAALAWATASLEVADTPEARRFSVAALWRGPTYSVLELRPDMVDVASVAFHPNGSLFAAAAFDNEQVYVWSETGGEPVFLGEREIPKGASNWVQFDSDGKTLVSGAMGVYRLRSVPGFELIREVDLSEGLSMVDRTRSRTYLTRDRLVRASFKNGRFFLQSWPFADSAPTTLGWWDGEGATKWDIDHTGTFMVFARGRELVRRPLNSVESPRHDQIVGRHTDDIVWFSYPLNEDRIAAVDAAGVTRFWSMDPNPKKPLRALRGPGKGFFLDHIGRRLFENRMNGLHIWDTGGVPDAEPLVIKWPQDLINETVIHQNGRWCATAGGDRVFFWPLGGPYPSVLSNDTEPIAALAFVGDRQQLVSASDVVRLSPLSAENGETGRVLWEKTGSTGFSSIASDPAGQNLLLSTCFVGGNAYLFPVADEPSAVRDLWPEDTSMVWPVTFSADGRHAAAGALAGERDEDMAIRVWNLESRKETVLPLRDGSGNSDSGIFFQGVGSLWFTPDGKLLSGGPGGVRLWNLETGEVEWIVRVPDDGYVKMSASNDTRFFLTIEQKRAGHYPGSNLTLHDRQLGTSRGITTHGQNIRFVNIDQSGTIIVTCTPEGVIRVGPADGSEPHFLFGHENEVNTITISPDGRWIASGDDDGKILLWPMPDLDKPPLHSLPHDELIAKLHSLTNIRVVRDEETSTGWKVEVGPFPGWAEVPEW